MASLLTRSEIGAWERKKNAYFEITAERGFPDPWLSFGDSLCDEAVLSTELGSLPRSMAANMRISHVVAPDLDWETKVSPLTRYSLRAHYGSRPSPLSQPKGQGVVSHTRSLPLAGLADVIAAGTALPLGGQLTVALEISALITDVGARKSHEAVPG